MALFGVTQEIIEKTLPIEGADFIELAYLEGTTFQFIIIKGQFKKGDKVLYFPIDALIPEPILKKLNLSGKLSGKNKNRVKTIKLKGKTSQGIVANIDFIQPIQNTLNKLTNKQEQTDMITQFLEVTKYEVPAIICTNANLVNLPQGFSLYNIEGADRYSNITQSLMNTRVEITEKLEGSNFSITYTTEHNICVNQRNYTIEPIEGNEHRFIHIAKKQNLIEEIKNIQNNEFPHSQVSIYGEFIGPGVQNNIYKLQQNEIKLFDINVDGKFLSADKRYNIFSKYNIMDQHVPILTDSSGETLQNWLDGKTTTEASHGISLLHQCKREGIVIKLFDEQFHPDIGRLILKQRDPIYLSKSSL
jgi:RNA ligase (TIGR02306 family)